MIFFVLGMYAFLIGLSISNGRIPRVKLIVEKKLESQNDTLCRTEGVTNNTNVEVGTM